MLVGAAGGGWLGGVGRPDSARYSRAAPGSRYSWDLLSSLSLYLSGKGHSDPSSLELPVTL